MARRTVRGRARLGGPGDGETKVSGPADATVVPHVLLGVVNGVEIVAVGALQLTRGLLLSAVSGAASIGSEALTAGVAGARGVVSAASRMVGEIAGAARGTFPEAIGGAKRSRARATRGAVRRPAARMAGRRGATAPAAPSRQESRARGRARRRAAGRPARSRSAA